MPDKPIPEQDPITSKSYALHYLIATIILIVTLFWALWDEAWGQRPWKAFQDQWKTRYTAFLTPPVPSRRHPKKISRVIPSIRSSMRPGKKPARMPQRK